MLKQRFENQGNYAICGSGLNQSELLAKIGGRISAWSYNTRKRMMKAEAAEGIKSDGRWEIKKAGNPLWTGFLNNQMVNQNTSGAQSAKLNWINEVNVNSAGQWQ